MSVWKFLGKESDCRNCLQLSSSFGLSLKRSLTTSFYFSVSYSCCYVKLASTFTALDPLGLPSAPEPTRASFRFRFWLASLRNYSPSFAARCHALMQHSRPLADHVPVASERRTKQTSGIRSTADLQNEEQQNCHQKWTKKSHFAEWRNRQTPATQYQLTDGFEKTRSKSFTFHDYFLNMTDHANSPIRSIWSILTFRYFNCGVQYLP